MRSGTLPRCLCPWDCRSSRGFKGRALAGLYTAPQWTGRLKKDDGPSSYITINYDLESEELKYEHTYSYPLKHRFLISILSQIHQECRRFGKPHGLRCTAAYGGGNMYEQEKSLSSGSEVVVATPGEQGVWELQDLRAGVRCIFDLFLLIADFSIKQCKV